jgi:hypothetical protein
MVAFGVRTFQELGRRANERDLYRDYVIAHSRRRGLSVPEFVQREVAGERDPNRPTLSTAFLTDEERQERKARLETWLSLVFEESERTGASGGAGTAGTAGVVLQEMAMQGLEVDGGTGAGAGAEAVTTRATSRGSSRTRGRGGVGGKPTRK